MMIYRCLVNIDDFIEKIKQNETISVFCSRSHDYSYDKI